MTLYAVSYYPTHSALQFNTLLFEFRHFKVYSDITVLLTNTLFFSDVMHYAIWANMLFFMT